MLSIAIAGRLTAGLQGEGPTVRGEIDEDQKEPEKEPPNKWDRLALGFPLASLFSRNTWRWSTWLNPMGVLFLLFICAQAVAGPDYERPNQQLMLLGALPGFMAYLILPERRLHRLLWAVIVGLSVLVAASLASDWLPLLKERLHSPPN